MTSSIIDELNLTSLPSNEQEQVMADVLEQMLLRIYVRILEALPPEARDTFTTLNDEGKGAEAETHALKHLPDLSTRIDSACAEVLNEYKVALAQET